MIILGENTNDIESLLKLLVAGGTLIGLLYKPTKMFFVCLKREYKKILKVHEMIEFIFTELNPNHGSSLTDKINRIDDSVKQNTFLTKQIFHRQQWILNDRDGLIFECDPDGNCTWVSDKYQRITKYDISHFMKHGWKNVIHEDDRERVSAEWESAIKEKRSSRVSFRIVSKDGEIYEVESTSTICDEYGYIGKLNIIKKCENC